MAFASLQVSDCRFFLVVAWPLVAVVAVAVFAATVVINDWPSCEQSSTIPDC